jgi:hypothetical protein
MPRSIEPLVLSPSRSSKGTLGHQPGREPLLETGTDLAAIDTAEAPDCLYGIRFIVHTIRSVPR